MALQFSTIVRNAMLEAVKTTLGTGARVLFFGGLPPANCGAANPGTPLGRITASSDFGTPSGGVMSGLSGTSFPGLNDGIAGHFRIFESTETICHIQGTITLAGGGGDMIVDSLDISDGTMTPGTEVAVGSFTLVEAGA